MFDKPPELKKKNPYEAYKKRFLINGAMVDSVDIKPEKMKTEVPVLVVPGWGATMESFEPGFKILTDKQREVISLDQPRKGGTIPKTHNKDAEEWFQKNGKTYPKLSSELLRQAETTYGLLEQKQVEKADVIAHSMGAQSASIAAMLHPEKFMGQMLVLVAPGGMIGKDNILRLQKGAAANTSRTETMSDILDEQGNVAMPAIPTTEAETEYLESTKHITPDYMKGTQLVRALKETWAISTTQLDDIIEYLRYKGIKVAVIAGVDDTMFPMDKMKKIKKNTLDGFLSVRGGHMQIQTHPELYMAAAESLLKKPETKAEGNA